jgi:predicted TIM-barrel fold metal-dependent hydrolase
VIVDAHTHVFTPEIIASVAGRPDLVRALGLEIDLAAHRVTPAALRQEAIAAGVAHCLVLPVAPEHRVQSTNQRVHDQCAASSVLLPAGAVHPASPRLREDLAWLHAHGVRVLKLSSFSQGFSLEDPAVARLLETLPRIFEVPPAIVLDTFAQAHTYFGTPARHTTTPERLGRLVRAHPGLTFVAAHMGGLAAPAALILHHLSPAGNLYLDTSNAAHVLETDGFLRLLEAHGPHHVLFGTDYPWFGPARELELLQGLLDRAGWSSAECDLVLGGNAAVLLGLRGRARPTPDAPGSA